MIQRERPTMIRRLFFWLLPSRPVVRFRVRRIDRKGDPYWRYDVISADDGRVAAISTRTDYDSLEALEDDVLRDFPGVDCRFEA